MADNNDTGPRRRNGNIRVRVEDLGGHSDTVELAADSPLRAAHPDIGGEDVMVLVRPHGGPQSITTNLDAQLRDGDEVTLQRGNGKNGT